MSDTDTIAVTVRRPFKDGTLNDAFKKFGYGDTWIPGRVRIIPRWLARRAELSGAELTIPDERMIEEQLPKAAPPRHLSADEAEALHAKRYKNEPRLKIMFTANFMDGSLSAELAAIGHPPEFKLGEIVELPVSLFNRLIATGAPMTTRADEMQQFESQQHKHHVRVKQWQEQHERAKADAAQSIKDAQHNLEVKTKIEELSARFIKAHGKARDAIALQLDELWKKLR